MTPATRCADAIRRVGGTAWRHGEGEPVPFSASVQPRWDMGEEEPGPLGLESHSRYVLYAPWDADGTSPLRPGDRIEWLGEFFQVCKSETFTQSGAPVYLQAVLRRESGEGRT